MGSTTFSGPVTAKAGFIEGADSIVSITAATATATAAANAGKLHLLNRAAGITVTLPAATGTGNVYKFFAQTAVTSNGYIIKVANATDVIQGVLGVTTDAAGVNVPTASTTDTITMSGSTTGGLIGSYVELRDIASGLWQVSGALVSSGAEATPFSATVS